MISDIIWYTCITLYNLMPEHRATMSSNYLARRGCKCATSRLSCRFFKLFSSSDLGFKFNAAVHVDLNSFDPNSSCSVQFLCCATGMCHIFLRITRGSHIITQIKSNYYSYCFSRKHTSLPAAQACRISSSSLAFEKWSACAAISSLNRWWVHHGASVCVWDSRISWLTFDGD